MVCAPHLYARFACLVVMLGEFRVIDGRAFELRGICNPVNCGAYCCRHLLFRARKVNPDDAEYFRNHGCAVVERGDDLYVFVPKKCKFLNATALRCEKYADRPSACVKYAKRETDLFKSDGCGLVWKPVYGRRAQVIMKKMRKGGNV